MSDRAAALPTHALSLQFRTALILFLIGFGCFNAAGSAAWAQQTVLRVTVRSTEPGHPIVQRAAVRIDSETERAKSASTDVAGLSTFSNIYGGTYIVVVTAVGYQNATVANVSAPPGTTTSIEVLLTPSTPEDIERISTIELIDRYDTSISTKRDRDFWTSFPLNAGNHQDITRILESVPGVAYDAINRFYPRGEDTVSTTMYADGFLMPKYAQGRVASFFTPETMESFRAITGGFSPEYTGSGLVLDARMRQTPTRPFLDGTLRVGEYGTSEDYFNFGTSVQTAGLTNFRRRARGQSLAPGKMHTLSYTVALSQRYSDNGVEPPQADSQTTFNYSASELFFGKFAYTLTPRTTATALINYSSGRSEIANRLGISDPFAQGFGFAGQQSSGTGLLNQQDAGQRHTQKDNDNLTLLGVTSALQNGGTLDAFIGASQSRRAIISGGAPSQDLRNLPVDSSVEFYPSVSQSYDQSQAQIDMTIPRRNYHTYKYGAVYHDLDGHEAYQLIPQSQTALGFLRALDPRLAPAAGSTLTPLLVVHRTGYYAGAYAQDTWRVRSPIVVNYGVRLDSYSQNASVNTIDPSNGSLLLGGGLPSVSKSEISPRLNAAITFPPSSGRFRFLSSQPTIARVSYNRLFSAPGMGQGDFIGPTAGNPNVAPTQPQVTDQYDLSLERQFGRNKIGRVTVYSKDIKNFLRTEQLIPGLQSDLMAILNQGNVTVDGTELSFELFPTSRLTKQGIHAYMVYDNSTTSPKNRFQLNNLGFESGGVGARVTEPFIETDQSDTLSAGVAYNAKNGSAIGLSFYYGSGLYSSTFQSYGSPIRSGARQAYSAANLRLASGPLFLRKRASVELAVENLFDTRERMDYFSQFAGTRYQQGRRVMLAVTGKL